MGKGDPYLGSIKIQRPIRIKDVHFLRSVRLHEEIACESKYAKRRNDDPSGLPIDALCGVIIGQGRVWLIKSLISYLLVSQRSIEKNEVSELHEIGMYLYPGVPRLFLGYPSSLAVPS